MYFLPEPNIALAHLECQSNQLTSLDVRNGNNHNFFTWSFPAPSFDATMNIQLYCIDVDNKAWSDSNWTVTNNSINLWKTNTYRIRFYSSRIG